MSEQIKIGDRVTSCVGGRKCVVLAIDGDAAWLRLPDGLRFTEHLKSCRLVPKPFAEVREVNGGFRLFVADVMAGWFSRTKDTTQENIADAINAAQAEWVKAAVEAALGGKP